MAEVLDPALWQAVGQLIDQNHRDFLAGGHSLSEDASAWYRAVDLFRATQDQRMVLHDPTPNDLRQHRTWIASLIAEGERLVTEAMSRDGESLGGDQLKLPDMEATLELLYLWQREWHGPKMPAARRREILKSVFNVEEPAT